MFVPLVVLVAPLGLAHLESRLLGHGRGRRDATPSRPDPATRPTAPGWAAAGDPSELVPA